VNQYLALDLMSCTLSQTVFVNSKSFPRESNPLSPSIGNNRFRHAFGYVRLYGGFQYLQEVKLFLATVRCLSFQLDPVH
jgi:hypothetical protein